MVIDDEVCRCTGKAVVVVVAAAVVGHDEGVTGLQTYGGQ